MIRTVRGTRDILPEETPLWREVEEAARTTFRSFAYREIRIPTFEERALFERSVGETTDIVSKEMYTFEDRGGRACALRPEGTAGVVRAILEKSLVGHRKELLRLWYHGQMFRYERPGKGRYREFTQVGAEAIGTDDPGADAEMVDVVFSFLRSAGFEELRLLLNSLGCSECRPGWREAVVAHLTPKAPELCGDCRDRLGRNPLRVLDCKVEECGRIVASTPSPLDHLCPACREHLDAVEARLEGLRIPYEITPRLVRGLDYYTRTVFEVVDEGLGGQNAVLGGGRYDNLVELLGGPPTPAIGFAAGVDRIVLLLRERKGVPEERPDVYIVCLGGEAEAQGPVLARELREGGISVELDLLPGGTKGRFRRAARSGAPRTLVLGEDELRQGVVTLKEMESGEQREVPRGDLLRAVAGDGGSR
jgi:histidyl-tRNA synthetase